jgi:hypothetical protein
VENALIFSGARFRYFSEYWADGGPACRTDDAVDREGAWVDFFPLQ